MQAVIPLLEGAGGGVIGPFTYTPVLFDTNGTPAANYGTGARVSGRYWLAGKRLFGEANFLFGTAGIVVPSGFWGVSLPPGFPANPTLGSINGDNSAGGYVMGWGHYVTLPGIDTISTEIHCSPNPSAIPGPANFAPWASVLLLTTDRWWKFTNTDSIAVGTTSKVITHNYNVAPEQVLITPTGSWQASSVVQWWVDTITATTFTVHATGAAGANVAGTAFPFEWWAAHYPGIPFLAGSYPFPMQANPGSLGNKLVLTFSYDTGFGPF